MHPDAITRAAAGDTLAQDYLQLRSLLIRMASPYLVVDGRRGIYAFFSDTAPIVMTNTSESQPTSVTLGEIRAALRVAE